MMFDLSEISALKEPVSDAKKKMKWLPRKLSLAGRLKRKKTKSFCQQNSLARALKIINKELFSLKLVSGSIKSS